MKKFAFCSEAAEREFGHSLDQIQQDRPPILPLKHLSSIGSGVLELKINGSPAFRCIYVAKFADTVFVLHSFVKTTNAVDRKAMQTARQRFTQLKIDLSGLS